MGHVIRTLRCRRVALLALVAVLTVAVGAEARAANRGKVVRYWERQLHTGGMIQLLDYRVLRCGPRACIVRWHIRAFTPGDEQDFGGFNEYVGQDACYPAVRVACDTRELTVRWVAAGGGGPVFMSLTPPGHPWRGPPQSTCSHWRPATRMSRRMRTYSSAGGSVALANAGASGSRPPRRRSAQVS